MRYGSLFAGIGGFDLGLDRAGMECVWQVEIDNHCNQILTQHWPNVRRFKDVKECGKENLGPIDLICGGFPCQDLSVAGKRSGLAGERSGLFFEFMRIIAELSPRWILIENVPGLLSSNGGQDMGTVLWEVGKLGYGWTYRVLDAQYFGLAQRRRRVFIVGCLGDARSAAKVLFEPESVCGDSPPSREEGERIAATITPGIDTNRDGWAPINEADNLVAHALTSCKTATGRLDPYGQDFVVAPLTAKPYADNEAQDSKLIATGWDLQRMRIHDEREVSPTLSQSDGKGGQRTPIVAYRIHGEHSTAMQGDGIAHVADPVDRARSLDSCGGYATNQGGNIVQSAMTVRRLTPTECERLQGFPDGWTEECSDSARYRMLGNAVAVPVAKWIGERIRLI